MSREPSDPPRHVAALRKRIENNVGGDQARSNIITRTVTTVAIGQLLPPSAVKGGTAMKLRLGVEGSRFSTDLDVARRAELERFLSDFDQALRTGWAGFTGEIRPSRSVSRPPDVPPDYIMATRNIKVAYNGRDLMTIILEVGHDELDDTLDPPKVLADDIPELFTVLGLPRPNAIPVVAHDHQIAQKLHAVSQPGTDRAHDLVDLQLLEATCQSPTRTSVRRAPACSPFVGNKFGRRALSPGLDGQLPTRHPLLDFPSSLTWTRRSIG